MPTRQSPQSCSIRWLVIATAVPLLLLLSSRPAFAQTGTVSGTVTDAGTGAPVAGMAITVVTVQGGFVANGVTNAAGVYTITVPIGALYYVRTGNTNGYLVEAFPDVQCLSGNCSSTDLRESEQFSITSGGSVTGRDFSVARGGTLTGTVTNAGGAGVANVVVAAAVRLGTQTFQFSTSTNATGAYTLAGLPAGTYFLYTQNNQGLRDEIYDDIPCVLSCQQATALTAGAPVVVSLGTTTAGRNFRLENGASITGVVTNAATGAPLPNVSVAVAARVGNTIVSSFLGFTNANGEYTMGGLATGTYFVYTSSNNTTNEIYPDLLCLNFCNSTTAVDAGGPVSVTLGAATPGINIALDPGLTVSGTITNEVTGLPAPSVSVSAFLRVGNSFSGRSALTNAQGQYTVQGLVANTYVLATSTSQFVNEVYDNRPCTGSCNTVPQLAVGTPVEVRPGQNTSGKNFALQPVAAATTGQISGVLTDAASGLPIAGISVETSMISGASLVGGGAANTNLSGVYTISGLVAGSYRVDTFGSHPYRNEVFDNIPCLGNFCGTTAIAGGTAVIVSAGATSTANFGLSAGDGISGVVTDSTTGDPIQAVTVTLLQVPSGQVAGSFATNRRGQFYIRGVPNGDYVAYTQNSQGYFDEIHSNIRCTLSCSTATAVASGTRITINGAAAFSGADLAELVGGINFSLDVRTQPPNAPSNLRIVTVNSVATFTWTAPSLTNAGAATSYLLEAGFSPNTTAVTLSIPGPGTNTTFQVPGVPPGTYYVRVKAVNAHGTSTGSNEVRLVVGAGGVGLPDPPTNVQAFMAGDKITVTWNAVIGSGGPATSYVVEAGSSSGASNLAAVTATGASFTFSPVPNGFYFLRVRARNAGGVSQPSAEVMLVVGNVPAPPSPPSLSHTVSGSTVTFTWTAPAFGPVTSYVVEAGSATGLSNLAAANVGNVLTQSFAGVPPGTYFVRVRALNAQGASIASNERIVTVS
jgi:hypothetical protein